MKFEADKGYRIKSSRFRDIIPSRRQNEINRLWWLQYEDGSGEWIDHMQDRLLWKDGSLKGPFKGKEIRYLSTGSPKCRSLRAFRRRLREYSKYLPKGTEFILMSKYIGHDITARIK